MRDSYPGTNPLVVVWLAVKGVYEDLFPLVAISLLTWLASLVIVLGPPAWFGVHEMARRVADGRAVSASLWWTVVRENIGRAWKLAALSLLVGVVLASNVLFYARLGGVWRYITVGFIWLLLVWGLANVYLWPVAVLQDEDRTFILFRNAVYLALLYPVHTVTAALILLVWTVMSVVLPIFLMVFPAFWAVYTTWLARQLILAVYERPEKS